MSRKRADRREINTTTERRKENSLRDLEDGEQTTRDLTGEEEKKRTKEEGGGPGLDELERCMSYISRKITAGEKNPKKKGECCKWRVKKRKGKRVCSNSVKKRGKKQGKRATNSCSQRVCAKTPAREGEGNELFPKGRGEGKTNCKRKRGQSGKPKRKFSREGQSCMGKQKKLT